MEQKAHGRVRIASACVACSVAKKACNDTRPCGRCMRLSLDCHDQRELLKLQEQAEAGDEAMLSHVHMPFGFDQGANRPPLAGQGGIALSTLPHHLREKGIAAGQIKAGHPDRPGAKRRQISRGTACSACAKAKTACDLYRPCAYCVRKGLPCESRHRENVATADESGGTEINPGKDWEGMDMKSRVVSAPGSARDKPIKAPSMNSPMAHAAGSPGVSISVHMDQCPQLSMPAHLQMQAQQFQLLGGQPATAVQHLSTPSSQPSPSSDLSLLRSLQQQLQQHQQRYSVQHMGASSFATPPQSGSPVRGQSMGGLPNALVQLLVPAGGNGFNDTLLSPISHQPVAQGPPSSSAHAQPTPAQQPPSHPPRQLPPSSLPSLSLPQGGSGSAPGTVPGLTLPQGSGFPPHLMLQQHHPSCRPSSPIKGARVQAGQPHWPTMDYCPPEGARKRNAGMEMGELLPVSKQARTDTNGILHQPSLPPHSATGK